MTNNNKWVKFSDYMKELKQKDPDSYNEIKEYSDIYGEISADYGKTLPKFKSIDEYTNWLKSPEGKNHLKMLKKFEVEADKQLKKRGGYRQNAGRKTQYTQKLEKRLTLNLTAEQAQKLQKLGGQNWIREKINESA